MKKVINIIRDLFHGYLGFAIAFWIYSNSYTKDFTPDGKYVGIPLFSAICGLGINFVFNWVQGKAFGINSRAIEYVLGGLFALGGGLIAHFYPMPVLSNWLLGIGIVVAVIDLIRTKKQ